ncbi:MAG: GlsB/YeaQ/YmgE family stress response membrane protein [Actinomycetota bacterium]|nr:GlsB/YeaQ/YmgE family stress response membrane protein [Actinomycetota bacterium]
MGILALIVVGLIAGLLAKLVLPGDDPGGLIITTLVGIAGAFVGGLVVGILGGIGVTGLNVWSILVATLGAVILLGVYRLLAGRRVV